MSKEFHKLTTDHERFEYIIHKLNQIFTRLDNNDQIFNGLYKKIQGDGEIGQLLLESNTSLKKIVSNHADIIRNLLDVQTELSTKLKDKEKEQDTNKDNNSKDDKTENDGSK